MSNLLVVAGIAVAAVCITVLTSWPWAGLLIAVALVAAGYAAHREEHRRAQRRAGTPR